MILMLSSYKDDSIFCCAPDRVHLLNPHCPSDHVCYLEAVIL